MRGFLLGSLTLIAIYVVVQPGTADKLGIGGNTLVALMRRAMSPNVAGIPDKSK